MDQSLKLLPAQWQTEAVWGFHVPGLGVALTLAVVFLTGLFAANFIGERLLKVWDTVLSRIPVVATIYSSVKQVSDTLLSDGGQPFARRCLFPIRTATATPSHS